MLVLTVLAEFSLSLEDQSAGNPSAIDLLNHDTFCQSQCSTVSGHSTICDYIVTDVNICRFTCTETVPFNRPMYGRFIYIYFS